MHFRLHEARQHYIVAITINTEKWHFIRLKREGNLMKKKVLAVALVAALALSMVALAGCSSNKLKIATSPDYPPYENLVNNKHEGLDIELGEAIAKELGYDGVEWVDMDFDAIIPAIVAGGKADFAISCFSIDPERAKEIDFSAAYMTDEMSIITMADADYTKATLNAGGIKIAAQSGTTCEDYATENFPSAEVVPFKNATDCYSALQAGQVQAVCTNAAIGKNMVTKYEGTKVLFSENTGEEYAIVIQQGAMFKDKNGEVPMLDKVNAAIEKLKADGTIDELVNKWLSESVDE